METFAFVLLALPVVVFAGYPLAVIVAASLAPRRSPVAPAAAVPTLSIVICAHNEAATIGAKLASVADALAAWPGVAEVIVGDDASADATADIAEAAGARVLRCPRGGKAAALNCILPLLRGDIVVMTDADPLFDAATLPALIAPFADPGVGAVAGRVETIRGGRARFARADRWFRAYESRLRAAEDRLFGCVSADGGLYAIRRSLLPGHVVADATDDFYISTAAVMAGRRIAFADDARVWEHSIDGGAKQFRRRVRITVRGLTGLWRRRVLLHPARTGWYAVALLLHKVARRLVPLVLVPLWIAATWLAIGGSGFWALVAVALGGAAAVGIAGAKGVRLPGPLRPVHGAMLHLAGLATGTLLFVGGRRYAQWTPDKEPAA